MKTWTKLIDGGYVSFVYGSRSLDAWKMAQQKFAGHLLCMDHRSLRSDLFPAYKSRRKTKRIDPQKLATYKMVKAVREMMLEDPLLPTVQIPGAEADDIIGILMCHSASIPNNSHPVERVVGLDKDLQQLPGISSCMVDIKGRNPAVDSWAKWPKYVKEVAVTNRKDWIFTQALAGDKSDSIPRLLSSSGGEAKRTYQNLAADWDNRYKKAYELFGEAFIINLKLVGIPYFEFSLRWSQASSMELMEAFRTKAYWRLGWSEAAMRVNHAITAHEPRAEDFKIY